MQMKLNDKETTCSSKEVTREKAEVLTRMIRINIKISRCT